MSGYKEKEVKPTYLVLDCEMSGLNAYKHGLIQVGALVLDQKLSILEELVMDINPPKDVEFDPEASKIHGFSEQRIKKGLIYEKASEAFLIFIKKYFDSQKPIIVGHFYPSDYGFLQKLLQDDFQNLGNKFIDTKSVVTFLNLKAELLGKKKPFPVTSLSKPQGLKEFFQVSNYQSHDALGDCYITREVLLGLVKLNLTEF